MVNRRAASSSDSAGRPGEDQPPAAKPRRRPLLIGLLVALLAIGLAYGTLPWWLPSGWLAERTARWVSELMRRPVRIERIELGWLGGVRVSGLQIDRRAGFVRGPFLRVGEVRFGLTPLTTWWTGRLDRLVFDHAELWVVLDSAGQLNITDIAAEGGARPITHNWTFDGATVHLIDLQREQQHDLVLGEVRCRLDPATAEARWDVDGQLLRALATEQPIDARWRAVLETEGAFRLPALNRAVELQGDGRIAWDRLELSCLPVQWLGGGRLRRLAGLSQGELQIALNPHLEIGWQLDCQVADFVCRWQQEGSPAGQFSVSQMRLSTGGHCDPAADYLECNQLEIHLPGLTLADRRQPDRPAVRLDRLGSERVRVEVVGQTDDIGRLRREVPELDLLLGPRISANGGCRFELSWSDARDGPLLRASLAGEELEVCGGDWLYCRPQLPSGADLQVRLDPDGTHHGQLELRLGELSARGRWRRGPQSSEPIPLAEMQATVTCPQLSALQELLPGLWRRIESAELTGPGELMMALRADEDAGAQTLGLGVALPAESCLSLPPHLLKPPGRQLLARGQLTLQPGDCPVRRFELHAEYGPARLRLASGPPAGPLLSARRVSPAGNEPAWRIEVQSAAELAVSGIEHWLALMPRIQTELAEQELHAALSGDLSGQVRFDLLAQAGASASTVEAWRLQVEADASEVAIDWPGQVTKPPAQHAQLRIDHCFDRHHPTLPNQHHVVLQLAGDELGGQFAWGPRDEAVQASVQVKDTARFLEYLPGLAERIKPLQAAGPITAELRSTGRGDRQAWSCWADATGLELTVPDDEAMHKAAGVALVLEGSGRAELPGEGAQQVRVQLQRARARLGDSHWSIHEGSMLLEAPPERGAQDRPSVRLRELQLAGSGQVVIDSALRGVHPAIERFARANDLLGQVAGTWQLALRGQELELCGELDATRLNVNRPEQLLKPPGERMVLDFDLTTALPSEQREAAGLADWHVHNARVTLGSAHGEGSGRLRVRCHSDRGQWTLDRAELAGQVWVPRLGQLARYLPTLRPWGLSGGLASNGQVSLVDGRWRLESAEVRLLGTTARLGQAGVSATGTLQLWPRAIRAEDLRIAAGQSAIWLNGHLEQWPDQPSGQVVLLADNLDFDEVAMTIGRFADQWQGHHADQGDQAGLPPWVGANLSGRLHAHQAAFTEPLLANLDPPPEESRYHLLELTSDFELAGGRWRFPFQALLFGGTVQGRLEADLSNDQPQLEVVYSAHRVQPRGIVPELIRYDFPELHPRGPVTMINHTRQRLSAKPGEDNYPVGSGELIIEGGYYQGPAAPRWLAKVFPGLNTARFNFRRMHDWMEKRRDGSSRHQMIYLGRYYHIYMQGISWPDRTSQYEVGLDLLVPLDSRFWAESGQGRIPIYKARVRLDDQGRRMAPEIRFVPPERLLYCLLRNNPLRTAYMALKRRLKTASPGRPGER